MITTALSAYERDMAQQADALELAASQPLEEALANLDLARFERIILTGMGSSDSVTIPFEIALARSGLPVWRIQASCLLEMPELITTRTLLWITSQSGKSGEVVALLPLARARDGVIIVATTNDRDSPLGRAADHIVELFSGPESTVSCKSYLNSLAWFHRLGAVFAGGNDEAAIGDVRDTARQLRALEPRLQPQIDALARRSLANVAPRLALIGTGSDAVTALAGALILKEASKVAAEGYAGGAFRHGPMELAGPGLTAILFGDGGNDNQTLRKLAADLAQTGSIVVSVTAHEYDGAEHIAIGAQSGLERLVQGMVVVQLLSVSLARQAGIVPGEFRFGQKITSAL